MNTLIDLLNYGQSYWLDNLTRKKITSGELKKRVTQQGLRGITSNPTIFNKAISGSADYDEQIRALVKAGKNPQQIYEALTIKDVQDACDILKSVYDASGGTDGFVSLEVSPFLARDTAGAMNETRRLFREVNRPNCFIKIPGTQEGVPAIEEMLYEGININITLLFSIRRYEAVARAYIRAMQRRMAEGKPVNQVLSVASFFLSRIDVLADQLLGQHIIPADSREVIPHPEALLGKAGIASARLAYQRFKEIFSSSDWKQIEEKGAHVQRVLWASTSTKDPLYRDVSYVEALIGNDTINTLPDETIEAFADHGHLQKNTIEKGFEEAGKIFSDLVDFNINIDFITQQLENEGIEKFSAAYNKLMVTLGDKRMKMLEPHIASQKISPGNLKSEIASAYTSVDAKQAGRRLFHKNPYLWKNDHAQVKSIVHRLGWLDLPESFMKKTGELAAFACGIKDEKYKDAVVLGMGGSSLCSEVAGKTFEPAEGYLALHVLDNTDPEAILEIEKQIDLEKTLFIVASKSGTTKEPLSFFSYFYHQAERKMKEKAGDHFIAITDEDTLLAKTALKYRFRKIFTNPSDIGGRYSVLSYFGLVPMALMGVDITALLDSAVQMKASCDPAVPASANPGISLGIALGIAQRKGRDKVTFVLSPSISAFGYWAEQLLAESTGKEGKGLIPVYGEQPGGPPEVYDYDRIFIHLYVPEDDHREAEKKLAALESAGHPIVSIKVPDKMALGGEFYRWEVATAVAGMVMGINPFDEPNVAESKKNTDQLLEEWSKAGSFKKITPLMDAGGIAVYGSENTSQFSDRHFESVGDLVNAFAGLAHPHNYIALLPYFHETGHRREVLQSCRIHLRDHLKVATTLGYGPRYLHSTGQLHKGGPDTGLYILFISDKETLAIPEEKYSFNVFQHAQALGDFRSLNNHGRRALLISLGKNIDEGLEKSVSSIQEAGMELY